MKSLFLTGLYVLLSGLIVLSPLNLPGQDTTAKPQADSKSETDKSDAAQPETTKTGSDQQTSPTSQRSSRTSSTTVPRTRAEDRTSRNTAKSKGDLTFDDIKFDIEKDGKFERKMLTKDIEALHKKTIRIRGYILPASVFRQSGIEEFVLVRDNMECCFGPGAALYDCIIVQMEKGKTADFTTRPVAVRGKFEIKEFKYPDSEEHYAIYQMIATEVK